MGKLFRVLISSLFLAAFVASAAFAQEQTDAPAADFNDINKRLSAVENKLKSGTADIPYMEESYAYVLKVRDQIGNLKKGLEKELGFTQKKLDALGETPAAGVKEVGAIAERRKQFTAELSAQKARVAEADVILARLEEVDTKIFNMRSKELLGNLFNKQTPLIYPKNLFEANKEFLSFAYALFHSPIDWYEELNPEEKDYVQNNFMPVLFVFFVSLWIGVYFRLFIMRKFGYNRENEHPRYSSKVSAAIFVAVGYGVIPAFIIAGMLIYIAGSPVLADKYFGMVLGSFLYFCLLVVMGRAISRVIFAPYNERWRLINVSTEKAMKLTSAFYNAVTLISVCAFLEFISDKSNYPIMLSAYIAAASCFVKAFFITLIIRRLLWDDGEEEETADSEAETEENQDDGLDLTFKITFFSMFAGIVLCGIAVFGYPFLSAFILNRLIMSFILVGFLFILRKAFEEIMHRLILLRFWAKNFRMKRKLLSKLNFWLNLIADPLFVLLSVYLILALWGVSTEFLNSNIIKLFTGFTIGGIKISLLAIALGIVVFFVCVNVVRALKKRLAQNVLNKMDIDDGIKNSLISGFGSVGFVISALLAIAIMGGDLSNFALIAGALSVGIGLGLQNIVNNFVSGIILLFERPIKVGDWVIINGEEGRVKQINIRATEVETFRKTSLIIPNANLLSTTVTNLTHSDNYARMHIPVGVSYSSDPHLVTEILLDCARKHKKVLKNPEPYVVFKDFGESSLDFELRCYTRDIWSGWSIPSDLRYEILHRFDEAGIEIPFPQRSLHIGDEVTRKTVNELLKKKSGVSVERKKRQRKSKEETKSE